MWRSRAVFALALVGLVVLGAEACTQGDPCLRHSDCPDEQKCAQGACVFGSRDGDDDTGAATDGATDGDEAGEAGDTTPADTLTDTVTDTVDDSDTMDASDATDADATDTADAADAATLDASETDGTPVDSASLDASETALDTSTDSAPVDGEVGG